MRRDLVQQYQRRHAARDFFYKAGLCKRKAHKQRLLLAGRTHLRRRAFGAVGYLEIAPVRPDERARCRAVAVARLREKARIGLAYLACGHLTSLFFEVALKR